MASENLFLRVVDSLNNRTGNVVSFLYIPLMLITVVEVALRYFFNRPSIWAWDVNIQLFAFLIVFGAGYTLLNNAHVKVDVITVRFSPRTRAIIDLITSFLFFICIGGLLWQSWDQAIESVKINEHLRTIWFPPIYPLRVLIAIGVTLFLLQGIAKFIRDIGIVRSGGGKQP